MAWHDVITRILTNTRLLGGDDTAPLNVPLKEIEENFAFLKGERPKVTVFDTAGVHIFTRQSWTTSAYVFAKGGGAQGGPNGPNRGGGGGGAGFEADAWFPGSVIGEETEVIVGAPGSTAGTTGEPGAPSSFGDLLFALGGGMTPDGDAAGGGPGGGAGHAGGGAPANLAEDGVPGPGVAGVPVASVATGTTGGAGGGGPNAGAGAAPGGAAGGGKGAGAGGGGQSHAGYGGGGGAAGFGGPAFGAAVDGSSGAPGAGKAGIVIVVEF